MYIRISHNTLTITISIARQSKLIGYACHIPHGINLIDVRFFVYILSCIVFECFICSGQKWFLAQSQKKWKLKKRPNLSKQPPPSSPTTTASFFLRVESFTILRLQLKMKPADRRNRFLENIFRSRERARGVFSSRDNKNSLTELDDNPLEIVIYYFRKRVSIRIPALLFASPRAGFVALLAIPFPRAFLWIGRLNLSRLRHQWPWSPISW